MIVDHRVVCRSVLVLSLLLGAAPARAEGPTINPEPVFAGWASGILTTFTITAGLSLTGLGIANAVYAHKRRRSIGLAVVAYGASLIGAICGLAGVTSDESRFHLTGAILLGLSAANAGLATWNLTAGPAERPSLSPAALVDSHGLAAPGLVVGGRF